MTVCAVKGCHNVSDKKKEHTNITFHKFPCDPAVAAQWVEQLRLNRHQCDWKPTKNTKICSMHFNADDRYKTKGGSWRMCRNSVPTRNLHIFCHELNNHATGKDLASECGEPQRETPDDTAKKNPLQTDCDSDSSDSDTSKAEDNADPLGQDGRAQCRFCGEFTKRFVDTDSELGYVTDNKTSLSINGINVEIDFNDQASKSVCVHCDKKLKQMLDFVKLVEFAQENLINLGDENRELLIVKTECDSNDEDDNAKDNDDTIEREIDGKKSESDETSTCKRKSNETAAPKQKKAKVDEPESEDIDLLIDIKEENIDEEYTETPGTSTNIAKSECDIDDGTVEMDNAKDSEENGVKTTSLGLREATTEPADAASELEMATRTLLNELGECDRGNYG